MSPFGDFIISDSHIFKKLTGFNFVKDPVPFVTEDSASLFLKIRSKKGLKRPNETTENKLESTLKLKYARINFGYFDT